MQNGGDPQKALTCLEHGKSALCHCAEILRRIEAGKIDTTPLITHRDKLEDIEEAYHLFENKLDGVIKVAIEN